MPQETDRVLIVEDSRAINDVLSFNLKRAGFEVEQALNPRIALELMEHQSFDLISTDYQMPEMNGVEFIRCLRQDPRFVDVPVMLCTAKRYEIDEEQLKRELNIFRCVCKPFSPREMVEIIQAKLTAAAAQAVPLDTT